jgi:hypothetical protein
VKDVEPVRKAWLKNPPGRRFKRFWFDFFFDIKIYYFKATKIEAVFFYYLISGGKNFISGRF